MRYLVGCAGQFFLYEDGTGHLHHTTDDLDEAIASCDTGPVGCEVYDTVERRWLGPESQEEIDDAKARVAARPKVPDLMEALQKSLEPFKSGES